MAYKKGKHYQLKPDEQEKVEEVWLDKLKNDEIPKMSVCEFWNKYGKELFPDYHKKVMNRVDKVYNDKVAKRESKKRKIRK